MTARPATGSGDAARHYFGTTLTPISFEDWLQGVAGRIAAGQRGWLSGHHNLHSVYLVQNNPGVAEFYQRCDECYLDGTPLRTILAGMGVATTAELRFSLMDRFEDLLAQASHHNWSIYYLGSSAEVVAGARELLRATHPDLRITLHEGYAVDTARVCDAINALRPDLLMVGMGMPRQEHWLNENLPALDVGTAMQAGATLDYYVGAQARPPRWLSRIGLAWLYRLVHDPARLWQRYLLEPWGLLLPTLRLWRDHRRGK